MLDYRKSGVTLSLRGLLVLREYVVHQRHKLGAAHEIGEQLCFNNVDVNSVNY